MTNVLIIIDMPELIRRPYADDLRTRFPQLTVNLVENHTAATPHAPNADVIMTFGPMLRDHVVREAPKSLGVHLGAKCRGNIEVGRTVGAAGRRRLVKRRNGRNLRACP